MFLVCSPGTETLALEEARARLPGVQLALTKGGVDVEGPSSTMARANLWLRLPSRVLLRLGDVEARDFGRLERGLEKRPWADVLPRGAPITVRAAATRCRLYHTGALAERVARAAGRTTLARVDDDDPSSFQVLLRGEHDRFTVSIDTSGELLHRRGWRQEGGEAPLRETLAAALLSIARHRPDEPLCDPMCGSGTLVIEAALAALGRAPGLARSFAFERFVGADHTALERLRDEARRSERTQIAGIVGADADPAQLAVARRNAERAGVGSHIEWRHTPLSGLSAPASAGLLVANPPYGKRIGADGGTSLKSLYAALGRALGGPFATFRAAVIVEDKRLLPALGMTEHDAQSLHHGGLRVWVGQRPAKRGAGVSSPAT